MARVTVHEPEPQPTPPPTYTVELSHDELVRLAAMSFRHEAHHPAGGGGCFYAYVPQDIQRDAKRLAERTTDVFGRVV